MKRYFVRESRLDSFEQGWTDDTYVMGATAGNFGQGLLSTDGSLKLVALLLRAAVLPVWRKLPCKRVLSEDFFEFVVVIIVVIVVVIVVVSDCPILEGCQRGFRTGRPKHAPVLLARAADADDPCQRAGGASVAEPRQDEVQRIKPHVHGRMDLARRGRGDDTLGDRVDVVEVGVEIDLGLGDDGKVGIDNDSWGG